MNLGEVYNGRHVLVTGHTGFKGSWLGAWLVELGADVTGVALAPATDPNLFQALGLAARLDSQIADIRDVSLVSRIFAKAKPEIIFHLAAQPLVRQSYADPLETFAVNVLGTANVLEAARATPSVRAVVSVTTDKVYDNHGWPWPYREIDTLGGLDPYSASKACAELVSAVYQKNLCRGAIAIATARGGNVVGGGDWSADRIVPDIVRAISSGQPIVLRSPHAVRPWQHVLELSEGYLELGARLLGAKEQFAEAWNFGPDPAEHMTVGELTRMMLEIWERRDHPVEVQPSPLHEAQLLRLDIAKATARLAWRPRLGVRDTLTWTAQWYRAYYERPDSVRDLTHAQIRRFAALAAAVPERDR